MRENFVQPLAIGFQANQDMQGRKTKRNPTWTISQGIAKSSHAMWNSKGQQLQDKFRALSGVHYIHTIYFFEAQEVKSPTLQTVCKSELKWRSYGHLKTTAPSWKWISQPLFSLAKFSQAHLSLAKLKNFATPFLPCEIFVTLRNLPV